MSAEQYYKGLSEAIMGGEVEAALETVENGLAAGVAPLDLINQGIVAAADQLGYLFQNNEIFLPELVLGGKAAKAAMNRLLPLVEEGRKAESRAGKVVLGTVYGDIHDIGKSLVGAMLGARGIEVYDLGVNVAPKAFVAKAEEVGADIIGLSALMSTSLYYQRDVIGYLQDSGKRGKYYVIVGGGPVTPEWAREIGADGVGRFAPHTVELCVQLLGQRPERPLPEPVVKW